MKALYIYSQHIWLNESGILHFMTNSSGEGPTNNASLNTNYENGNCVKTASTGKSMLSSGSHLHLQIPDILMLPQGLFQHNG